MHLKGFRFAARIRNLGDTKLYIPKRNTAYAALRPMIGGTLNIKHTRAHWDEFCAWPPRSSRARSRPR